MSRGPATDRHEDVLRFTDMQCKGGDYHLGDAVRNLSQRRELYDQSMAKHKD